MGSAAGAVGSIGKDIINAVVGGINTAIRFYDSHNSIGPIGLPDVPAIPKLAAGGPVLPGSSYIVGERGPELFMPDIAGRIIPNNMLSAAAASRPILIGPRRSAGADAGAGVAMLSAEDRALLRSVALGVEEIAGRPIEVRIGQRKVAESVNDYARSRHQHGDPAWA